MFIFFSTLRKQKLKIRLKKIYSSIFKKNFGLIGLAERSANYVNQHLQFLGKVNAKISSDFVRSM